MIRQLLLGSEDWSFLWAVAVRTTLMFLVILGGLRLMGKRGISQLSVFELGVIIGLGSAAGDPMFYKDVGLLSCLIVFVLVLGLYLILERLMNHFRGLANKLEGQAVDVVRDGALLYHAVSHEELTTNELFVQLRLGNVSHLGQVRRAILEPNGRLSVFYAPDDEVRPGLPVLPDLFEHTLETIPVRDHYSCVRCGYTALLDPSHAPGHETHCPRCDEHTWTRALSERRVT